MKKVLFCIKADFVIKVIIASDFLLQYFHDVNAC